MTDEVSLDKLIADANAKVTDKVANRKLGEGEPIFELYHMETSADSQKVRICLIETGVPHIAHDLSTPEYLGNYDPTYVKLRMRGAPEGIELVKGYTGNTSVDTEGFDPAVVPTLVDLKAGKVICDSAKICAHIVKTAATEDKNLYPEDLKDAIDKEITIIDRTPHVGLLYGANPDVDFRPASLAKRMTRMPGIKIEKATKARDLVAKDDPDLLPCFEAKLTKEEEGAKFLSEPDRMREITSDAISIIAALEERLHDGDGWLLGDRLTLADLLWAVSLNRFKWLGASFLWEGGHQLNETRHPKVCLYAEKLFKLPSFQEAVINWPSVIRPSVMIGMIGRKITGKVKEKLFHK